MTPLQLRTLHTMYSALKKLRPDIYDDDWLRLLVRNAGNVKPDDTGHVSTKNLDNVGLENVLAVIEQRLHECNAAPGHRWRDAVSMRSGYATSRQVWSIKQLAPQQRYDLRAMCLKFSDGRAEIPERLTPAQAHKMVEFLKSAIARYPRNPSAEKMPAGVDEGGASTGDTAGKHPKYTPTLSFGNQNSTE
jgi:hypothetical protein